MTYSYDSLVWIPLLPLLGSLINGLFGNRLPRLWVGLIAVLASTFAFLVTWEAFDALAALAPGAALEQTLYTWMAVGALDLPVAFRFDALTAVMCLTVTGVGSLIHLYSLGYMEHDPGLARYFAYLNLFMFSMLILVLGASWPILFVGWVGVGLCSYLLIGFWFTDQAKAAAGMKAFVVNRIGDLGFLLGMFILFSSFSTLSVTGLQAADLSGADPTLVTAACLFLFVGACGKSAQLPLYVWLPDAMAGPTPVSALIHAATMVTAGVYMVCRLSFLFVLSPAAMSVVACVGAMTALFAATIGLTQTDIKKVLAYSTVSQLGYMFMAAGVGAFVGAIFHLVTHAFFKACLFLCSGSVIHGMEHAQHEAGVHGDPQDIRRMGGLRSKMPITALTFGLSTLAIAGVPGFSGFFSKDEILWNAWALSPRGGGIPWLPPLVYGMGLLAALCTAIYMGRVFLLTFWGDFRAGSEVEDKVHESPLTMTVPLLVLGALAVLGGLMGIPHTFHSVLHMPHYLAEWLAPVLGGASSAMTIREGVQASDEMGLTVLASVIGLAGLGLSFLLYAGPWMGVPSRLADSLGGLYRLVRDKYRVDELYDAIVVRPLLVLSDFFLHRLVDRFLIDTVALGIPRVAVSLAGGLGRRLQSGNVQWYASLIMIGLATLIAIWAGA